LTFVKVFKAGAFHCRKVEEHIGLPDSTGLDETKTTIHNQLLNNTLGH